MSQWKHALLEMLPDLAEHRCPPMIRPEALPKSTSQPSNRLSRVLFVHDIETTFIIADLQHLETFCEVTRLRFRRGWDYLRLVRGILRADIVYCWFALDFAAVAVLFAKLVGRKSLVVAGGWDVAGFEEIGYGRLLRRRGRLAARIACGMADLVLAFSEWSAEQVRRVSPGATVRRAYLGISLETFRPGQKEELVACVANVNRENVARKGLRTFVRAASMVPEAKFVLVGRWLDESADELRAIATPNLTVTGWLETDELRDVLSRAKVYCQVSYTEGFGLALAEAMASGCVPIVCPAGAIPEVVGDAGLYVAYGDEVGLASAVRQALQASVTHEARDRVQRLFPENQRLGELRRAIQDLQGPALATRRATTTPKPAQFGRVRR